MENAEIIKLAVSLVVAVLSSSVISTLLSRYFAKKDKNSAETKGIMFNLLISLQNEARRLISMTEPFTMIEYNQFVDVYKTYKELGGDGYADLLREEVEKKHRANISKGNIV